MYEKKRNLDLTSEYILAVNRTQLITQQWTYMLNWLDLWNTQVQMGKELTWDLQVNASAVSVKMIWIKAEKPVAKTGDVARQPGPENEIPLSFEQ